MFRLLLLLLLFPYAVPSQFIASGDTTADYGGDAHYRCTLTGAVGVLQVTWQRLVNGEPTENLATYSRRFGTQIDERHTGKVVFSEVSLNSTSITVRNVTWADEACYVCSFNAFPGGSTRRQTCLTVQGISVVKTDVQRSDGDAEVVVSCSATGKPTPVILWRNATSADLTKSNHRTAQNDDGTFTTMSNLTLPPHAGGSVDCLVTIGQRIYLRQGIQVSSYSMEEGEEETDAEPKAGSGILGLSIAVVVMGIACVVIYFARTRIKRSKDGDISMCLRRAANV